MNLSYWFEIPATKTKAPAVIESNKVERQLKKRLIFHCFLYKWVYDLHDLPKMVPKGRSTGNDPDSLPYR
jgi:hypothetical protein